MELIEKYFPHLSDLQKAQFARLAELYKDWNEKINVVSRKDIDQLYLHHILHSLCIAKYFIFPAGAKVIDVGTGGGFPGIPLAIYFPDVTFHLIDSIGKKIKVVEGVAGSLELKNVTAQQIRSNELKEKYHYVVSRAVTEFPTFVKSTRHLLFPKNQFKLKNGIIYLKGGDLEKEIEAYKAKIQQFNLRNTFNEDFFDTKKIIYLPN